MDIDFEEYIDVPDLYVSGRQRVIEYVNEKYGSEKICQILAMGTMGTRSVLKDTGRALGIDHMEINEINKKIPMDSGAQWSLADCLYGDPSHDREPIKEVVKFAEKYPELFETSLEFQGMPRHISIHAAGVIISPDDVTDVLPLCLGKDGEIVAQFDKHWVEELGCLKMDFLGLRTLGAMHKAVDLIKERHGVTIDIDKIPYDDPDVLNTIREGFTDGIFQIESPGMRSMFREMNEVTFEDIIVGLSMYRPGPMQFIPQYIASKNGFIEPKYLFPELKEVLGQTYGIMAYQEQVIAIAQDIAGFSEGAADNFRRGIGKKDEALINHEINVLIYGQEEDLDKKQKYIPGLVRNGIPLDKAKQLGEDIVSFSRYAFNKSHSAAYAVVTMQTGFLKTHYPTEYLTALISSYIQKSDDKISQYIQEAKRLGIKILPPDINNSEYEFSIEDGAIRYGLGAIKGLNKSAVAIIADRNTNGKYTDLVTFLERFNKKTVNKKTIDALALSGSLTSISTTDDRIETLKKIYELRGDAPITEEEIISKYVEDEVGGAKQMYSKMFVDNLLVTMQILQIEKAFLGMYLSSHPLDDKAVPIDWTSLYPGDTFELVCLIKKTKVVKTKKGDNMAFITVETLEGDRDFTVFSRLYEACKGKLDEGGLRVISGVAERDYRDPSQVSYQAKNIKYFRDVSERGEM